MPRKKSASKKALEVASKKVPAAVAAPKKEKKQPKQEEYSSESEDSVSEDEDEFGELITNDVESGISEVLTAIKLKDPKLFDPNVKFFEDPEKAVQKMGAKKESHKPMYLKDYHRMNLLTGGDTYEEEEIDMPMEKTYVQQQAEDKEQILSEIKNAFGGDEIEESDDEDFLKKKAPLTRADLIDAERMHPSRKLALPTPEGEGDQFLDAFIGSTAWIPQKGDKMINLDKREGDEDVEDDEEFDDAVDNFERVYNFRYEDSSAAEIVSYARTQATLRRSKTNSRKKAREQKHEDARVEKEKKNEAITKKKSIKVNKVMDRLKQIKEAVGDEVSDETITRVFGDTLMKDDYDEAEWDAKMTEIFDEQYYNDDGAKPEWSDDSDMMNDESEVEASGKHSTEDAEDGPVQKKSKKDKLKDKKAKKKEKESIKDTAEKIVLKNTPQIIDEVEEEQERKRGRSITDDVKFKYREVSPDSFGLTSREIFLADDKDLNDFIGLKKFAPYRPKDQRMKDKRKYAKAKNLKEWRKRVFKNENGPPEDQ
ncbi:hypothetical protein BABINDRAFT_163255 [Babjeviella inositovora NRRL Y-12698]|uniref:Kri1-like C-terminal domain-containing protein n=1 Tax=Babjeviella inositovora NRRL Y-12698 TaxID=984486 RepID=A0A1E3QJQ1_9ASCO|nr:uncharacterized protein BABINDRAFT_163255 [Babjeviella inositovora NRRL Y-12698]ODQ77880.1 hypothetical protein BABINDRAFT_163255 [Babjeviella inositovora NRRL Y-12698]